MPVVRFEKTGAASVQTKRFPVLPAVPGLREKEPLSSSTEPYLVNDTIDDDNDGDDDSVILPGGFSPVPAVPGLSVATSVASPSASPLVVSSPPSAAPLVASTTESIISSINLDSRKLVVDGDTNNEDNDEVVDLQVDDAVKQRKQFKRCHGKCVQKFCLPINELTVFDSCSTKCKGICSE